MTNIYFYAAKKQILQPKQPRNYNSPNPPITPCSRCYSRTRLLLQSSVSLLSLLNILAFIQQKSQYLSERRLHLSIAHKMSDLSTLHYKMVASHKFEIQQQPFCTLHWTIPIRFRIVPRLQSHLANNSRLRSSLQFAALSRNSTSSVLGKVGPSYQLPIIRYFYPNFAHNLSYNLPYNNHLTTDNSRSISFEFDGYQVKDRKKNESSLKSRTSHVVRTPRPLRSCFARSHPNAFKWPRGRGLLPLSPFSHGFSGSEVTHFDRKQQGSSSAVRIARVASPAPSRCSTLLQRRLSLPIDRKLRILIGSNKGARRCEGTFLLIACFFGLASLSDFAPPMTFLPLGSEVQTF
ncbi:hypothetical protein IEQ34_008346 [Dendrobium chrysotoxum]|uniref:Uncharacterized protein n=1 Tax=Dendrobium chrysotoxum TaxID=161865 RepID=A0AAV7GVL8_DENCH|nr:hypothetical protein IEQ34_008346 [Dendrobium chrysotoxum]